MTRRSRRNHSGIFKAKVAFAAIKGDKTLAQLAQQFDVHANQIVDWKKQLEENAESLFNSKASVEVPDVKPLQAKIGQLTMENDFLEGALLKAGLLSARR
jgi:transposase